MRMSNTVQQIGQIDFQGNIVPMNWFKHIKTDAGLPDSIGVMLLSDIIYWYRPVEVRDEATGKVVGYRTKFKEDKLQRSYDQFAEQFGFSKNQVRRAIKRLEEAGLITIELRDIVTKTGLRLNNVMYVEPVAEKIKEITCSKTEEEKVDNNLTLSTPMDKFVDTLPTNLSTPLCKNVDTNTETSTETTTESKLASEADPVDKLNEPEKQIADEPKEDDYFSQFIDLYQKEIGLLSPTVYSEAESFINQGIDPQLLIVALQIALEAYDTGKNTARRWAYMKGIIRSWQTAGILTFDAYWEREGVQRYGTV